MDASESTKILINLNISGVVPFALRDKTHSNHRRRSRFKDAMNVAASLMLLLTLAASVLFTTAAHAVTSRIVGGIDLPISNAPATVALLNRNRVELDGNLGDAQFCGGTVIDPQWVVTAAHCLIDDTGRAEANEIMVLIGSADLADPSTQPVAVTQIIYHENYTRLEGGFDVALLRLEISAQVTPAELDLNPVTQNEAALIAGWGSTTTFSNPTFPSRLQAANVIMTPGENCSVYPFTDERFICARPQSGSGGNCLGDSGGPLYRLDSSGSTVRSLVGISSFSSNTDDCRGTGNPTGYTNVAAYSNWLFENAGIKAPSTDEVARTGITLRGAGWWQIQRTSNYQEVYQGQATFVSLEAGLYNVVNLSTGYKVVDVDVRERAVVAVGSEESDEQRGINLTGEGWWQIQDSSTYRELYQGRATFVSLNPGSYNIINLTTGYRETDIIVP